MDDTPTIWNNRLRQLVPRSEWRRVFYKTKDPCRVCGLVFLPSTPVYHVTQGLADYFVCTDHELDQEVMHLG